MFTGAENFVGGVQQVLMRARAESTKLNPLQVRRGHSGQPSSRNSQSDSELDIGARGDLRDPATFESLRRRCLAAVRVSRVGPIVLDLAEVTVADTKVIALLLLMTAWAHEGRNQLYLRVSSVVREWVQISGAGRYLWRRAVILV